MNTKQLKQEAARFYKFVEWSKADGVFIGRCPALFDGAVHGKDEAMVYKELCEAVEEWIAILHGDGKPLPDAGPKQYSGKFQVRANPALHRRIAAKAQAAGESLNEYVVNTLAKA
jgi:predicted HicB family RNase H-like nuclease